MKYIVGIESTAHIREAKHFEAIGNRCQVIGVCCAVRPRVFGSGIRRVCNEICNWS